MTDVWATLAARLGYAAFVPTPNASIERSDLRRGDGTPYTVLDVLASLEADDFTALVRSSGKGLGDLRESASQYVGTHLPTTW